MRFHGRANLWQASDLNKGYRVSPIVGYWVQLTDTVDPSVNMHVAFCICGVTHERASAGRPGDEVAVLVVSLTPGIISGRPMDVGVRSGQSLGVEGNEGVVGVD
jgi:hypothetical protein